MPFFPDCEWIYWTVGHNAGDMRESIVESKFARLGNNVEAGNECFGELNRGEVGLAGFSFEYTYLY